MLDAIERRPLSSAKELAPTAGLSEKVAELVLTWLRKNVLVQKVDGVYRLTVPRRRQDDVPALAHDAFRARGLGKTCAVALAAIEQRPIGTARTLADATALTPDAAERALTRLRRAGVVEKIGGVYQRIHKTLEQVAEECGTAGIGKKQRRQHQHERERFRKAVENGELQPGHGKKRLHVQPTSQPPAPNWDDLSGDAEAVEMEPLKVAASFKRRRKRSEEQTLCEEVAR